MAFVHEFRYPWVPVHSSGTAAHYADFLVGHTAIYKQISVYNVGRFEAIILDAMKATSKVFNQC